MSPRHSPFLAFVVWVALMASVVIPRPAPASPPAQLVLGTYHGPPIPAEWVEELERIADLAPPQYRSLVITTAKRHSLDPRLLASVAWVETGGTWDPTMRGTAGEIGLMQVLPSTAAWIAQQRGEQLPDLADPAVNLDYGAWYLRRLLDGATASALAEYNAGPAWRDRAPTVARAYSSRVMNVKNTGGR
jgi:soluble lytic murein transglycosylase-like protein